MNRKEKIIEILNTYQSIIPPLHDEGMVDPMDFHKVADAIMAIPIEVPSEEEIEKKYSGSPNNHIHPNRYRKEGAKWMHNEILKRNGKDNS